mmetsp:Transcript_12475/g.37419  ORF Transcript_12475/g.37419 Transcript_12475/m.37419 type:complete len:366 (-) Transcript_12475:546-1643(-)
MQQPLRESRVQQESLDRVGAGRARHHGMRRELEEGVDAPEGLDGVEPRAALDVGLAEDGVADGGRAVPAPSGRHVRRELLLSDPVAAPLVLVSARVLGGDGGRAVAVAALAARKVHALLGPGAHARRHGRGRGAKGLVRGRIVVHIVEATSGPEELVGVVVVRPAGVALEIARALLGVHALAHGAVEGRDDAAEEPAGRAREGAVRARGRGAELEAHGVEEIAQALGHVAQVGSLAPDEEQQDHVCHARVVHVRRARARGLHAERRGPLAVGAHELGVYGAERALEALVRGRVGEEEHEVLLLASHGLLLETEAPGEELERVAKRLDGLAQARGQELRLLGGEVVARGAARVARLATDGGPWRGL